MAHNTTADRVKRFLGIRPEDQLDDSDFYDDGLYLESEPSAKEALAQLVPTVDGIKHYFRELFPFWGWIFHYNLTWLLGDLIAGITVGFVVVPQGMAYAGLANLPPEFGLYTSFVGFFLYWAFATSKDITIGTVAVMSTIVGNIIIDIRAKQPELEPEVIARALALISGIILLFIGLTRLGFIVEFIPLTAIGAFMTGSAISIAAGQVPTMLGIPSDKVKTREETYKVIINTLKHLGDSRLDAAMGLTALFGLYFIRWFCAFMGKRNPNRSKMWFFISTLRMAFIVILYILVSWLVNRGVSDAKKAKFKILGPVPSGFQHVGAPTINTEVLSAIAPNLPVTVIVLLIEHIAISKSFGRVNNYMINPSQELVAIGFSNVFGPFLGGYPATGSFSRTAIKAKAGVRTPLAGIFTAVIVLLALYALTSVFFYIPSAGLAAIIIHAVGDLITPPREVYKYWQTSPIEVVIFFAGVFVSIFTSIENGIYVTVAASGAILLWRIAKSPGTFLGRVHIQHAARGSILKKENVDAATLEGEKHSAYLDLRRSDLSNPQVPITSPYPGVFIYRFGEGLNYVNCARHLDNMTIFIYKHTRRTQLNKFDKIGDRPWNDPGPRRGEVVDSEEIASKPKLKAVILDFSAVNVIDVTATQALVDIRTQFNKYTDPETVEWYFAGVSNRWTKRALVAAGFGVDRGHGVDSVEKGAQEGVVAVSEVDPDITLGRKEKESAAGDIDLEAGVGVGAGEKQDEIAPVSSGESRPRGRRLAPIYGVNRPYFHIDVETAVASVVRVLERRRDTEDSSLEAF
ncbi:sulfate transporter family-domain-containing protein [Apiosordaria backusii]|uniref:Sulfate transporter family-domain-containing protein n=1 Tax=Apiosordaria backusii TaxID=314023 RepID=A0AA40DQC2_9PEZI|nr:sulfate transporter family-domain-containing protein [Apiosordaria backusii]